jgi:twitching motility protein PilT
MALTADNLDRALAEHLVASGDLSRIVAAELVAAAQRTGSSLVERLAAGGDVAPAALTAALASLTGLRHVPPEQLRANPVALDLVGEDLADDVDGLPLAVNDTRVVVAFALPPSAAALDRLAARTGREVMPVLSEPDTLREVRRSGYEPTGVGVAPEQSGGGGAGTPPLTGRASSPTAEPPQGRPPVPAHLDELLDRVLEMGGSDLHLTAGIEPKVRVHGSLKVIEGFEVLDSPTIERLVFGVLGDRQIRSFEQDLELDTSYSMPASRFRVNVFRQRGSVGAVMRVIPFKIPDFDALGLPPVVKTFADLPRGMVLVTGPTGSGKSTTLASLLDIVNRTKPVHILSCEDPIEFLHQHRTAIVNQREVGQDTHSFANALKRALREDPDVILVGEMRDLETIHMALTAAETGHLVLGTLHTQSAPQTVDRLIDVFPPEQQGQVRVMLATSLQGVVTQQLLPTADGKGRALAAEVLVATSAVRNLIREAKGHQIPTQMQAGAQYGMVTMEASLAQLVKARRITVEMALERSSNPDELRDLLGLKKPGGRS